MTIVLVSTDRAKYLECCSLLGSTSNTTSLSLQDPEKPIAGKGIFLWDYQCGVRWPDSLPAGPGQQNLLLVHRHDLAAVEKHVPSSIGLILKPLTRAKLNAFLPNGENLCAPETLECERADRDNLLQKLLEANLRLQMHDQDRTNFLARAVHDFRAPLMALSGYCDLMIEGVAGAIDEDQREILKRMQQSSRRLSRMSSAVLQLTVDDDGEAAGFRRPVDFRRLIDAALREIAPLAEDKHIELVVDGKAPAATLYLDPSQIEQVFVHLLENACKASPKFGRVQVSCYPYFWERRSKIVKIDGKRDQRIDRNKIVNALRVDITDSGSALTPGQLARLFDQYVDSDEPGERIVCGLSLAVCRLIIERHSGTVWAETNPGGVTFSFVVPFNTVYPVVDHTCYQNAGITEKA